MQTWDVILLVRMYYQNHMPGAHAEGPILILEKTSEKIYEKEETIPISNHGGDDDVTEYVTEEVGIHNLVYPRVPVKEARNGDDEKSCKNTYMQE